MTVLVRDYPEPRSTQVAETVAYGLVWACYAVAGAWYWSRRRSDNIAARSPGWVLLWCALLFANVAFNSWFLTLWTTSYCPAWLGFFRTASQLALFPIGIWRCFVLIERFEAQRIRLAVALRDEGFDAPYEANCFQRNIHAITGRWVGAVFWLYVLFPAVVYAVAPPALDEHCNTTNMIVPLLFLVPLFGMIALAFKMRTVEDAFSIVSELKRLALIGLLYVFMTALIGTGSPDTIGSVAWNLFGGVLHVYILWVTLVEPLWRSYYPLQRETTLIVPPELTTLAGVLRSVPGRRNFEKYCMIEFSLESLLFVTEVDALHAMHGGYDSDGNVLEVTADAARERAVEIYRKFILPGSTFEVNISHDAAVVAHRELSWLAKAAAAGYTATQAAANGAAGPMLLQSVNGPSSSSNDGGRTFSGNGTGNGTGNGAIGSANGGTAPAGNAPNVSATGTRANRAPSNAPGAASPPTGPAFVRHQNYLFTLAEAGRSLTPSAATTGTAAAAPSDNRVRQMSAYRRPSSANGAPATRPSGVRNATLAVEHVPGAASRSARGSGLMRTGSEGPNSARKGNGAAAAAANGNGNGSGNGVVAVKIRPQVVAAAPAPRPQPQNHTAQSAVERNAAFWLSIFDAARTEVYRLLETNSFARYTQSALYEDLVRNYALVDDLRADPNGTAPSTVPLTPLHQPALLPAAAAAGHGAVAATAAAAAALSSPERKAANAAAVSGGGGGGGGGGGAPTPGHQHGVSVSTIPLNAGGVIARQPTFVPGGASPKSPSAAPAVPPLSGSPGGTLQQIQVLQPNTSGATPSPTVGSTLAPTTAGSTGLNRYQSVTLVGTPSTSQGVGTATASVAGVARVPSLHGSSAQPASAGGVVLRSNTGGTGASGGSGGFGTLSPPPGRTSMPALIGSVPSGPNGPDGDTESDRSRSTGR